MKYLFPFFLLLFFKGYQFQNRKYSDCTLLRGVYKTNTGEKWRLKILKRSPKDYFVLQCDEKNCDDDVDQYTFIFRDCDNDPYNGVVVLCPSDKSRNVELTFTNCSTKSCNYNLDTEHFTKITFNLRGNPVWTATYSCSDN